MPFKRPQAAHRASSGYSSGPEHDDADEPPSKRAKMGAEDSLSKVKLYIVQGKLDVATIAELFGLAEHNCERLVRNAEDADVIVTSITMRKRFERHVPWEVAVSCPSSQSCLLPAFRLGGGGDPHRPCSHENSHPSLRAYPTVTSSALPLTTPERVTGYFLRVLTRILRRARRS